MLELNVYDKNDNIIKTVTAKPIHLLTGTVRKLSKIIKFGEIGNKTELAKDMYDSWSELTELLTQLFPDMTDEEWDMTRTEELISLIFEIEELIANGTYTIPTSGKVKN